MKQRFLDIASQAGRGRDSGGRDFTEGTAGLTTGGPNRAHALPDGGDKWRVREARAAGIHGAELQSRRAAQERARR